MSVAVSVLLPSYNHEEYIEQAIQSVLDQDFEDWELVVIDDASSDASWSLIQSFQDPRIHAMKNPTNLGVCHTYNKALEIASGEIIMVLGSDDRFRPNKMREQVEHFHRHPETGIIASWIETTPSTRTVNEWFNREIDLNDPIQWLARNNIAHCSVAVRANVHRKIGTLKPEFRYTHDWDFWLRAIELDVQIDQIPLVLADYRVSDDGLGSTDACATLQEYMMMCLQHWHPYLLSLDQRRAVVDDLANLMVRFGELLPEEQREPTETVIALLSASTELLPAVVQELSLECRRLLLMARESSSGQEDLDDAKEWLRESLIAERQRTNSLEVEVAQLKQEVAGLRQRPADRLNQKLRRLGSVLRD